METRLAAALQELDRQSELHGAAEQRAQQLQKKAQSLELELFTAGVSKDEQSHDKQQVSSHRSFHLLASSHFSGGIFCANLNCGVSLYFNTGT